jgi:hypothetical protein
VTKEELEGVLVVHGDLQLQHPDLPEKNQEEPFDESCVPPARGGMHRWLLDIDRLSGGET